MIANRVRTILKHYNLTAAEFAQRLGIQKSSISHLLSGRNKPSFQFISKLAKNFPEINLHWFITGEGAIFNQAGENTEYANLSHSKNDDSLPPGLSTKPQKKLADKGNISASQVENIIMVYDNDTFKILNKS